MKTVMPRPITALPNLGPKSARMLAEVGIETVEDLAGIGALDAYHRLRFAFGDGVSLNFLWAMVAGLRGTHWREVTADEKALLKAALDT